MKYHVNHRGNPGPCRAKKQCPFGSPEEHFSTAAAARSAYEQRMKAQGTPVADKTPLFEKVQLLKTIHGSHLYGLAHANSDVDYYTVYMPKTEVYQPFTSSPSLQRKTIQVVGEEDEIENNLSAFLLKADEGSHQALEAMFSPYASGPLDSYRNSYYLNTAKFARTYRRTITNFARLGLESQAAKEIIEVEAGEERKKRVRESLSAVKPKRISRNGMEKYRRHSIRLLLNYETGLTYGRFNPALSEQEKEKVYAALELSEFQFAELIQKRIFG